MTNHTLSNEKNLLRRLQQGDEMALNELMEAYKRPLGRNMVRILKSTELAEDALQELFLNVWLHRGRINPERPAKAYLFGIARNLVNEALRKSAREEHMLENYQRFRTAYYTHVEESLLATENRELLSRALEPSVILCLPYAAIRLLSEQYDGVTSALQALTAQHYDYLYAYLERISLKAPDRVRLFLQTHPAFVNRVPRHICAMHNHLSRKWYSKVALFPLHSLRYLSRKS